MEIRSKPWALVDVDPKLTNRKSKIYIWIHKGLKLYSSRCLLFEGQVLLFFFPFFAGAGVWPVVLRDYFQFSVRLSLWRCSGDHIWCQRLNLIIMQDRVLYPYNYLSETKFNITGNLSFLCWVGVKERSGWDPIMLRDNSWHYAQE